MTGTVTAEERGTMKPRAQAFVSWAVRLAAAAAAGVALLLLGAPLWLAVLAALALASAWALLASEWPLLSGAPGSAEEAERRNRRLRSLAIALILFVLAVLFYAVTIVRLGGNVAKRKVELLPQLPDALAALIAALPGGTA